MSSPFKLGPRSSGLLLHVTSLPGPHGCGDMGPHARRSLGFLQRGGQRWWQMLPVHPADHDGCPYSGPSAFAGNRLLVSLEALHELGLLSGDDLQGDAALRSGRVDYAATEGFRVPRLWRAFEAFRRDRSTVQHDAFLAWCEREASWLDDYALFTALKAAQGGLSWVGWPADLRARRPEALLAARARLAEAIEFEQFVQFQFDRQWHALRSAAHAHGIGLIGDLPIFVRHDSVDVWAHPALFWLERRGQPAALSGAPPDQFNEDGQLWGHPLYRWSAHRSSEYRWWLARMRRLLDLFDVLRIDHFLGFTRLWAIYPEHGRGHGSRGRWLKGPGADLLGRLCSAAGPGRIIAEDLGAVTPQAEALRDRFELPGMRVLQFGFDEPHSMHDPAHYVRHCVAYTGTHDNNTVLGWLAALPAPARQRVDEALARLGRSGAGTHRDLVRMVLSSAADLAIIPVQDLLGLGSEARMNVPGTVGDNWTWRLSEGALDDSLAAHLRDLTAGCSRLP